MLRISMDYVMYDLLHLSKEAGYVKFIDFFIYDSVKVLFLIIVMVSFIGVLRTYVSEEKIKEWIKSKPKIVGHLGASLFGALTPFCSCSSIPLFLSFVDAGIPLGVTFSFLITSPILNEYLFALMIGFFGFKIAIIYAVFGVVVGVVSGMVLGALNLEHLLEKDIFGSKSNSCSTEGDYSQFKYRLQFGWNEGLEVVKKIWKWVLIGVAIGAFIHNYVPQETIDSALAMGGWFTVPIVVALGVPMYGSCAAIVPIAVVLFNKGVPLGTALAFMMAVSALSLPEAIILRRAMKLKLIAIFFSIVAIGIVVIGYFFNFVAGILL